MRRAIMSTPLALAAVTDEFSPDLSRALPAIAAHGFRAVELRMIGSKNVADLNDAEVDAVRAQVEAHGLRVLGIASPLLKCVLPDAPPLDPRFQQDIFGAQYHYEDQPRLADRVLDIATRAGARLVRVFSYWRTVDPARTFDRVAAALPALAVQAHARDLTIGLENEHACNVATGSEAGRMLRLANHPGLGLIWDPANALVTGERPYPEGYAAIPITRIVHVHAKDCRVTNHQPTWGPIGDMDVRWREQLQALVCDGYTGAISLETHWSGPHGDKFEASEICADRLSALVTEAAAAS
jgi:L-ribulose-5-phosphate 3-epimerase